MSIIQTAQGTFGNKAEELDDSNGENEAVKPTEFFWDNIVLFVVSSIIGLAAVDVVTEFLRGGGVSCFSPVGVELSEAQGEYINSYCAGFLPPGAYIPAFMVIHAVLITIPHFLWLSHYGGNFNYFFQLTSALKRLRDEESGEHVRENLVIVEQLETTFATYEQNGMFLWYIVKLIVQLLWSLAGIFFVVGYFFRGFNANFYCPRDSVNVTETPFWPLDDQVVCVFETLDLLQTIWWAEIALLALVCLGLILALIWCLSAHGSELGAKDVALFSFQSGLAPAFYVPPLPVPRCFKSGRRALHSFFTSIPWLIGPRIKTNLDFLLLKLYRTDSGLGHVFKEVQIEKELKILKDDDQRRLYLHWSKQANRLAKDGNFRRDKDRRDRDLDEQDLKWIFPKVERKLGVYRDFITIPFSHDHPLLVTDTMRGAVLAFGQRAPDNKNALNITFGDSGYATALARVFQRTALVNFHPYYKSSTEVVTTTHYRTPMVSLVFADDVLSSGTEIVNNFISKLKPLWKGSSESSKFIETSFIVVGPIPRAKDFNITNVDLLLEKIYGCLKTGAVMLTIRPLEIAGKDVSGAFLRYEPNPPKFLPREQEHPTLPNQRTSCTEWPARKSLLGSSTGAKATPKTDEATPTAQAPGDQGAIALQPLQPQPTEKLTLLSSSSVTLESPSSPESPCSCSVVVKCGQSKCTIEFSMYECMDDPLKHHPGEFDPPKETGASSQGILAPSESSVKTTTTVEVSNKEKTSEPVKEKNVNNLQQVGEQ